MRTVFFALLVAACSVPSNGGDPDGGTPDANADLLPGFAPPDPGAGEIRWLSPIVRGLAPGSDTTLCSYLPLDVALPATSDIVAAHGYQSAAGSHHALLLLASRNRPVDTHVCTDDDMTNTRFLAGAGGGDAGGGTLDIPPGLAFRVDAGRQIMIQTHWINATDHPIDGQAAFVVKVQPPSTSVQPAQLLNWGTSTIDVPPNSDGHAHAECPVAHDLQIFTIGGHAHEWGTHVSLAVRDSGASTGTTFYDHAWMPYYTFDPPRLRYDVTTPMVVKAGQVLTADCDYHNTTASDLGFPKEMCVGFAFFFPGDTEIDCFDGVWPSN